LAWRLRQADNSAHFTGPERLLAVELVCLAADQSRFGRYTVDCHKQLQWDASRLPIIAFCASPVRRWVCASHQPSIHAGGNRGLSDQCCREIEGDRCGCRKRFSRQTKRPADKDNDVEVRRAAALTLGQIKPAAKTAVPGLIELLKDTDWQARCDAASALGKIGLDFKTAIPALTESLKDKDGKVRSLAAWALWETSDHKAKIAITTLTDLHRDKDATVRSVATSTLGKLGPEAKTAGRGPLFDTALF
jgi:hypothetical protein